MKVAYKWKLTNDKSAYITSEEVLGGKPFIHSKTEKKVYVLSEDKESKEAVTGYNVADNTISFIASSMARDDYESNLNDLRKLLKFDENGMYYALGNVSDYYAEDENDCLTTEKGITVSTNVVTKTIDATYDETTRECLQAEAYVHVSSGGTKDNQVLNFEFGIPRGCVGPNFDIERRYQVLDKDGGDFCCFAGVIPPEKVDDPTTVDKLKWFYYPNIGIGKSRVLAVPSIALTGPYASDPESDDDYNDPSTGHINNVREITNGTGSFTRITGYNWKLVEDGDNHYYSDAEHNGVARVDVKSTGVEIKTDKPENPDLKVSDVRIDRIGGCVNNNSLIITPFTVFGDQVNFSGRTTFSGVNMFYGQSSFLNTVQFNKSFRMGSAENPKINFEESGKITSQNTIHAKAFYTDSDKRLKNIIGDINLDIDKILELSLIYYTFNNDPSKKEEIGVIAQEIKEVCPQIVSEDENGMLSVDYSKLSILALYCIKDLYGKLNKD
nr:MAG TPA_asm: Neck appendage protein [Caudoviricetes sp.]